MRSILVSALLLAFGVPAASQECLQWGEVELTGIVLEGVYPGPPEFISVADGDQALDAVLLHLAAPICIDAGAEGTEEGPVAATELVQLACNTKKLPRGTQVTVSGGLFPRHTGYHVTPALLDCTR